jgi:hypothetical protein
MKEEMIDAPHCRDFPGTGPWSTACTTLVHAATKIAESLNVATFGTAGA